MRSFYFFDKNRVGYIKSNDLCKILLSLCRYGVSKRFVNNLVKHFQKDDKIFYRHIVKE